jgi:hypothetical protein
MARKKRNLTSNVSAGDIASKSTSPDDLSQINRAQERHLTIENEGTAQPADPAVPGEGNGVSEGGEDNSQTSPGVQKRFDQLTAEKREMQRQLEEQQKLTQTLLLQQMQAQQQAQRQPEPQLPEMPQAPEGMDPVLYHTFLKAAEVASRRQTMELERRMAPLLQQTHRTQADMTIVQEAGGNNELAQRAQRRYAAWVANNLQGDPRDAVLYEEGLMAREARSRQTQSRDELGRFNQGARTLAGAGGPITNLTPPAEPPVPEWANPESDNYDVHRAPSYWKQRIMPKSK